ncbi:MAG: hypothetical protein WD275_00625 [Rhodothermales bacterium]
MKAAFHKCIPALMAAATIMLSGCEGVVDSADSFEFATADLAATLTQELDLTDTQQASLQVEIEQRAHPDVNPGGLWYVAVRLQESMTERQAAKLFQLADRLKMKHLNKLVGVYGPCLIERPGLLDRIPFYLIADVLTDEQQAEVEEIRSRYHEQLEAIRQQVQSGELTQEEAAAQAEALHAAMAEEIRNILTDDQLTILEERIAARGEEAEAHLEANKAAMIEALGLSETQVTALDELHRTQCEAFQGLVDQAGDITRDEFRSGVERLVNVKLDAYADILDEEQFEGAKIHDALLVVNARRFIHHVAGGPPGGGNGRPGGTDGGARERPGGIAG